MDRIKLTYATEESDDLELPFRVLVLGDFSLQNAEYINESLEAIQINRENFNSVLKDHNIVLRLSVKNHIVNGGENLTVTFPITSLDDLSPDSVVAKVPDMKRLVEFKNRLVKIRQDNLLASGDPAAIDESNKEFLSSIGIDILNLTQEKFNFVIAEIVYRMNKQLDEILHTKEYIDIESIWRGLHFVVEKSNPRENCTVDILDISKMALRSDFEEWNDISESTLFKLIYEEEFGQFGGKPFGVIIGVYKFSHKLKDLELLKNISKISSISHCPFIADVSPEFFGIEDLSNIAEISEINDLIEKGVQYQKWRSFRSTDNSKYIGLTLPGFKLRSEYDYRFDNIKSFNYKESGFNLWGNASYAFASCLLNSFVLNRWCLNITGPEWGKVTDLFCHRDNVLGKNQLSISTQMLISEEKDAQLTQAGFIPLTHDKSSDYAVFYSASSVRNQVISDQNVVLDDQVKLNLKLESQLPYLMVICRLAHYLKIIQRDNIGTSKTRMQIEKELNRWLSGYVSDMDNPSQSVKSKRPLRKAKINVESLKDSENWYLMKLTVMPHLSYMGADFSISLKGRLSKN
ncbi:MAG: type VI secretion system contractile sheath large subunit [Desulfobacterales bacterium]|nr:type VI secretion system contractile sheath large subunit [Desulfobacterales bacterium]